MTALYNEIDPYAAQWLRNLIDAGLLPPGDVDERSIVDLRPSDLDGYTQVHFFAGLGGWGHALRLAGWPDERPIWTGSCPCQPFSVAGKGAGTDDPRHLWPHMFRLIRACRPPVVMGEQVAGAAGYGWLDGVRADLEGEAYASRGVDIPACAVDAPHIRSRLYWVAVEHAPRLGRGEGRAEHELRSGRDASSGASGVALADADGGAVRLEPGRLVRPRGAGSGFDPDNREGGDDVAHRDEFRRQDVWLARLRRPELHDADGRGERVDVADAPRELLDWSGGEGRGRSESSDGRGLGHPHSAGLALGQGQRGDHGEERQAALGAGRNGTFWSDAVWLTGADGKSRRAQPGLRLLAHGVSARVGRLRAYGNAIVPQVAAEVIRAFMEPA